MNGWLTPGVGGVPDHHPAVGGRCRDAIADVIPIDLSAQYKISGKQQVRESSSVRRCGAGLHHTLRRYNGTTASQRDQMNKPRTQQTKDGGGKITSDAVSSRFQTRTVCNRETRQPKAGFRAQVGESKAGGREACRKAGMRARCCCAERATWSRTRSTDRLANERVPNTRQQATDTHGTAMGLPSSRWPYHVVSLTQFAPTATQAAAVGNMRTSNSYCCSK